jgi:hypothetical protein
MRNEELYKNRLNRRESNEQLLAMNQNSYAEGLFGTESSRRLEN